MLFNETVMIRKCARSPLEEKSHKTNPGPMKPSTKGIRSSLPQYVGQVERLYSDRVGAYGTPHTLRLVLGLAYFTTIDGTSCFWRSQFVTALFVRLYTFFEYLNFLKFLGTEHIKFGNSKSEQISNWNKFQNRNKF
jgi:hypothetical protein